MVSSCLNGLSAHVGSELVAPRIRTLFYQLQGGIFPRFQGWYTEFATQHIHLLDTEPVSWKVRTAWQH